MLLWVLNKANDEYKDLSEAAKKQIKLLWVACGNKDNLLRISQGVHAYLKEKNAGEKCGW